MACILIDNRSCGRYEKRTEIPREPMCVPVKVRRALILKKLAVFAVILIVLIYFTPFTEKGSLPNSAVFIWLAAACIGGLAFNRIEVSACSRLRDPLLNHQKYKYQGRILSSEEPHYLLHLNYYRAYKTWTLPDETEQGSPEAYDNNAPERREPEAHKEFVNSLNG